MPTLTEKIDFLLTEGWSSKKAIDLIKAKIKGQNYGSSGFQKDAIVYKDMADYRANSGDMQGGLSGEIKPLKSVLKFLAPGCVIDVFVYKKVGRGDRDLHDNVVVEIPSSLEESGSKTSKVRLYHYSESEFSKFSLKHASKTAIWGPAIYFSSSPDHLSGWGKNLAKTGYLYTVDFSGDVIDITKPLPDSAIERIERFIGKRLPERTREDRLFPFLSLERSAGSATEGIKGAGYDALAHPMRGEIHYAVVNLKSLKIVHVEKILRK